MCVVPSPVMDSCAERAECGLKAAFRRARAHGGGGGAEGGARGGNGHAGSRLLEAGVGCTARPHVMLPVCSIKIQRNLIQNESDSVVIFVAQF